MHERFPAVDARVGGQHAAFTSGDVFRGVKTERRRRTDHDAAERRQRPRRKRGHLRGTQRTEIERVIRHPQTGNVPLQPTLRRTEPRLQRRGIYRNVLNQHVQLLDRQRHDRHNSDHDNKNQDREDDRNR